MLIALKFREKMNIKKKLKEKLQTARTEVMQNTAVALY